MIAANHHRTHKHAWHGELHATISAAAILAQRNHLLHVMTNHRCSGALSIQSSRFAFRVLGSIFFLFVVALAAGQTSPPAPAMSVQSSTTPMASTPSPEASKYVGAETCKTCHEEIYNAWEKTPHWKTTLNTKGGPSKQGCEGCHGPGADHVAGGGDKTKIFVFEGKSRQETSARCLAGAQPLETSVHHPQTIARRTLGYVPSRFLRRRARCV